MKFKHESRHGCQKKQITRPQLISISGALHSGKSTIARRIALEIGQCGYIDGDIIANLIPKKYPNVTSIEERSLMAIDDFVYLTNKYLRAGISVVLDYVLTDDNRIDIENKLKSIDYSAVWVLLKPDENKVLQDSSNRLPLSGWEKDRIKIHYGDSTVTRSNIATIIDSTNQTPEETFYKVRELL